MTRTQAAERIATRAIVFTRKARRDGHSNTVTTMTFQEAAQELGISGDRYSLRTVKAIARQHLTAQGETSLIGF